MLQWPPLKYIAPCIYMAGILLISSIHGTADPEATIDINLGWLNPSLQNLLHFPLYGGLAVCWYWALSPWKTTVLVRTLVVITICTIFGAFDEYYQSFIPGRTSSLSDLGRDFAGILLAVTLLAVFLMKR